LTENTFTENVKRLESIYSTLINDNSDPQQEAEMRIELIDILSNIEASLIPDKDNNKAFIQSLESTREILLNWDPTGHWFKHEEHLVDNLQIIINMAKSVVFNGDNIKDSSEARHLKTELDSLKSELNDLKSLMNSLLKEKKATPREDIQEIDLDVKNTQQDDDYLSELDSITPLDAHDNVLETSSAEYILTTDIEIEPPIILPMEIDEKESEEIEEQSIKGEFELEPMIPIDDSDEGENIAPETLKKLAEKKKPEAEASHVLDQMKSIISEAEVETTRQISRFKESLLDETAKKQGTPIELSMDEQAPTEPIIPPTEPIETDSKISDNEPIDIDEFLPIEDPYMLLLTLEAEKYRLEKEMEENETEFQEGLKTKKEFDDNIQKINEELKIIRKQIENLRAQLKS